MLSFFYFLGVCLYGSTIYVVAFFNPKARLWIDGRKKWSNKLEQSITSKFIPGKKRIWIHAASTGEFEQAKPLIEKIKKNHPEVYILVSFFSPSGLEAAKKYAFADLIFYLPLDTPSNAKVLLKILKPDLVLWIKYEYWWNILHEIKVANLPVLLVSSIFQSRQPFFKWYGKLHRQMLGFFTHIFVQNDSSVQLLGQISIVNRVSLSGDTRFDRVVEIAKYWQPIKKIEDWINGTENVIVAGSSWPHDENIMKQYANQTKDTKFIIVPHHVDHKSIEETLKIFPNAVRYSQMQSDLSSKSHILIMDTMGMLSRIYKYAKVCFIGGAFSSTGLHNTLEAAVYGKPILFGPDYSKFDEAVGLSECGGAFPVSNAKEWEETVNRLLTDHEFLNDAGNKAGNYVISHAGATNIIMDFLYKKRLLTN